MMTKEELLATARELEQPPREVTDEFGAKRERLAAEGNRRLGARRDLQRLVGSGNEAMAEDNNRNFARFMESIFHHYQPEVLLETVLWVFRAYRSHGFQTTYWPANLDTWVELLREELSQEAFEAVYPFYDWLIVHIPWFVKLTDEQMAAQPGQTDDSQTGA
jgi:hypothetical protein